MVITMQVAAVGVNRTLLQRLLGGSGFALAFRREVYACLDVSHTAAATLPPSRRCRVNGALLDELLLVTGLALLLQTNLRAEPCEKLHATDASPSAAGGCAVPITQEAWLALYDLAEEQGEHVRPSNVHDGRAAAAPLASKLTWATMFSCRFFKGGKHINRLELESLISLLRRITREGIRTRRLLVLVDSCVVLWEPSRKDDRVTQSQFLVGVWCLAYDIALESVWVPTWANPVDATFTEQTYRKLACIVAKAPASDRSLRISPCPVGAGSAS